MIYATRGEIEQAIKQHQEALKIAESIGDTNSMANALNNIGLIHEQIDDHAQAIQYFEQALALLSDAPEIRRNILSNLGTTQYQLGELSVAYDLHEEALRIAQQAGDKQAVSAIALNLGNIELDWAMEKRIEGETDDQPLTKIDVAQALTRFQQALHIQQELQNPYELSGALLSIGRVHFLCAEVKMALKHYRDALQICQDSGAISRTANVLSNMTLVYQFIEEYDNALDCEHRALALYKQVNNQYKTALTLQNMGQLYARQGNYEKSFVTFEESLTRYVELNQMDESATTYGYMAETAVDTGDFDQAVAYYRQAIKLVDDAPLEYLNDLGNLYVHLEKWENAQRCFDDGLKLAQSIDDGVAIFAHNLAEVYQILEKFDRAIEMYQLALSAYATLGDTENQEEIEEILRIMQTAHIN